MRLYSKAFVFTSFLISLPTAMMAVLFLVLFQPAIPSAWSAHTAVGAVAETDSEVKFIGDYRKDLKAFIKRTKNDEEPVQRIGAIVDLCLLHDEIVNDQRFDDNYQLKGFRAVAAERLTKCRKEIELEIKRFDRAAAKAKKRPPSPGEIDEQPATDNGSQRDYLDRLIIEDMQVITQISGGPVRLWSYTGGNHGPQICDFGPDLVRLIETTINADFWRRNGGTGIIEYYQPLRILVVSASAQVHDNLTDLLRKIR